MSGNLRHTPLIDRLPGGAAYAICSRCVMDTSDPDIEFDELGECNHCRNFRDVRLAHTANGGAGSYLLERQLDNVRKSGQGKLYDCVIGMSGGLDSSFLAYLAKERFGLRPLAVHMDNGWDSALAVANIRNIIDRLDMDYESVVLDWPSFRSVQLAFLRASVPEAETPTDVAIPEALHSVAARYGIRHILSAGNLATEGILPRSWQYNARDAKYFRSICGRFGSGVPKKFDLYDYRREAYFKLVEGISTIYPLNHIQITKREVLQLLTSEFGFTYYGQKHHESRYTRFIQSYYLVVKFGIDYRRTTYSSLIVSGQMSRDEALVLLIEAAYDENVVATEKEYIAKKLRISSAELDEIISRPPSYYWLHPNDERRLNFIYTAYRRLFRKEKLASV